MEGFFGESGISTNWITALIVLLIIAALIHFTIEVVYFTRMIICYILARFIKKKIHILEKCAISGQYSEMEVKVGDQVIDF
jgi:hypothetical protein